MGRAPCCEKVGLKRGRWAAEEDQILTAYIRLHGEGKWRSLPKDAGLLRCGKSCRLRWINYLRDDLKRGNITKDEEEAIVKLHSSLGNRWSLIAAQLSGRTDNEIKNYWNSHLRRKIYTFHTVGQPHSPCLESSSSASSSSTSPSSTRSRNSKRPPSLVTAGGGSKEDHGEIAACGDQLQELRMNEEQVAEDHAAGPYEWLDSEMNRLIKSRVVLHEDSPSGEMKDADDHGGGGGGGGSSCNSNSSDNQRSSSVSQQWLDWDQITGGGEINYSSNHHHHHDHNDVVWDEGEDDVLLSWLLDGVDP